MWSSTWATRVRRHIFTAQRLACNWWPTLDRKPAYAIAHRMSCSKARFRFVLTTPLRSAHPIAQHIHLHGDAVRVIALWVDDARQSWYETTSRGAVSVEEPHIVSDEYGTAVLASIRTYGDTIHTFVERSGYLGPFLPGYRAVADDPVARPTGLLHIDHMVGNVGWHEMNQWVDFYANV